MKNKKGLKRELIFTYIKIIITSIIFIIITTGLGILYIINDKNKSILPANYYEQYVPKSKELVSELNTDLLTPESKKYIEDFLPESGIRYQVIEANGDILYGNTDDPLLDSSTELELLINDSRTNNKNITYPIPIFDESKRLNGALVLNYDLKVSTTESSVWFIIIWILISPFIYITIFTIYYSNKLFKKISNPIRDVINATKRIQQNDLNFQIDTNTTYDEIASLLKAFEDMRSELENSLIKQWNMEQERNDMIASISHDLRTPLTIIRGHIEGLQAGLLKNEEILNQYLFTVNKNVIRMGKLLEDINNVNKIENFNFILAPEEVDIYKFFEQKILEYSFLTDEKNIQLHHTFESKSLNLTTIVIDKERFNQVIDNLFMNSLRFTPENGGIFINMIIHHTCLEFNILDTGPGFRLQNIKDIFQKFYQEDQSRSIQKGHYGLGLYIVKKIVEKHKGSVKGMNSNHPDYKGAHIKVKLKYLQSSIKNNKK